MRVTFLGTGTSHGIPVLACSCPVCLSRDPHDKRYRSSIMVENDGTVIVIDTGYEFRLASIRAGLSRLDAVLYTHSHSDHIMGLDDLRVFTRDSSLPIYANESTLKHIENVFSYAFKAHDWPHSHVDKEEEDAIKELKKHNFGLPLLIPNKIEPFEKFKIGSLEIEALPAKHGMMDILGYRIGNFAYMTDISELSEKTIEELKGVDTLVLGALREKAHPTHFTFKEAEEIAKIIKPRVCYFTHISHETSYSQINKKYGPFCLSAYDNMVLEVD